MGMIVKLRYHIIAEERRCAMWYASERKRLVYPMNDKKPEVMRENGNIFSWVVSDSSTSLTIE